MAAVSLVLVAGCGGGGSSNASSTTSTAAGSSSGATGNSGAGAATTAPSFVGSANSAYCNLARNFSNSINPNLSNNPKAAFQQFDSVSGQFLSTAPSAIQADAQEVVSALKMVETAFKNVNYDVTKLKPTDLTAVQDPKFTASANRIDAYDTQVCGITTSST